MSVTEKRAEVWVRLSYSQGNGFIDYSMYDPGEGRIMGSENFHPLANVSNLPPQFNKAIAVLMVARRDLDNIGRWIHYSDKAGRNKVTDVLWLTNLELTYDDLIDIIGRNTWQYQAGTGATQLTKILGRLNPRRLKHEVQEGVDGHTKGSS